MLLVLTHVLLVQLTVMLVPLVPTVPPLNVLLNSSLMVLTDVLLVSLTVKFVLTPLLVLLVNVIPVILTMLPPMFVTNVHLTVELVLMVLLVLPLDVTLDTSKTPLVDVPLAQTTVTLVLMLPPVLLVLLDI